MRAKARFSVIELLFGVVICGAITLGLAAFGVPLGHSSGDRAATLPTARERDLASAAAREQMAAISATPFERIGETFGESGGTFDVERLSPAVPGQPVGSTEITQDGDDLRVTVRVVWETQGGSADRLEMQGTISPPPVEKASTAAAVSVAPPQDLPFDIDAMTLITAGWMGLVGLVLIGAVWHRRPCCESLAL